MDAHHDPWGGEPVVARDYTYGSVTDKISLIVLSRHTPWSGFVGFAAGFLLLQGLLFGICWTLAFGVGTWGINIPVAWGFAIINFVW